MNEIKRCPFRKGENSGFAPCYGAECMAYLEYGQPLFSLGENKEKDEPPIHMIVCKMMAAPMFYSGGCA